MELVLDQQVGTKREFESGAEFGKKRKCQQNRRSLVFREHMDGRGNTTLILMARRPGLGRDLLVRGTFTNIYGRGNFDEKQK